MTLGSYPRGNRGINITRYARYSNNNAAYYLGIINYITFRIFEWANEAHFLKLRLKIFPQLPQCLLGIMLTGLNITQFTYFPPTFQQYSHVGNKVWLPAISNLRIILGR